MARIETLASLAGGLAVPAAIAGASTSADSSGGYGVVSAINGELGAAGTPIFAGFLRELGEYNPMFAGGPFASFMIYEQMRRSDGRVASVLSACKLPIASAEWAINPPEDATDAEKEAGDFIRDQMFVRNDVKEAIRNALLMLDFGCAAHEDIWVMDKGQVCLKDMAARLPLTFYRWETQPGTDKLAALNQMGYRAGDYVQTLIPVGKLALFTYRQEGANYAGRALLREMYQHWYTKSALYAISAIAAERGGMGVPVITMGPKNSVQDRVAATAWVQSLIVHEKTGIVLPPEWTFKLQGVEGEVYNPEPLIQHHDAMIAACALASFIVMGQSGGRSSGNRSLGETMSDFFFNGLQATADQIGQVITKTTIARLMQFNFPPGVRAPTLVPQDLIASKIETIGTVLQQLSAGMNPLITPDTDLEAWLREKLGAPERMPNVGGDDPETQADGALPAGKAVAQPGEQQQQQQQKQPPMNADARGSKKKPAPKKVQASEDPPLRLYSPDQARDEQGKFGEGGGLSKSDIAKASFKPSTLEKQKIADRSEQELSHGLGMERTADNAPFDLESGHVAVEVKTLIDNKNDKITMHPDARERKLDAMQARGLRAYTVVADKRGAETKYYAAHGVGSFRIGSMQSFGSVAELRGFVR